MKIKIFITDFSCPIGFATLKENAVIAPNGKTYDDDTIQDWIDRKKDAQEQIVDPIDKTTKYTAADLRPNKWMEAFCQNVLSNNANNNHQSFSNFSMLTEEAIEIDVSDDLLINSATGKFFINPVVNENGITVEAENKDDKKYQNRQLKQIISQVLEQQEKQEAQKKQAVKTENPIKDSNQKIEIYSKEANVALINFEELKCGITADIYEDAVIAPSGHSFSKNAIEFWLNTNTTNPETRQQLTKNELRKNNWLKLVIDDIQWDESKEFGYISIDLLKDATSGKFFKNPCVNSKGDTVEAPKGSRYKNLLLAQIIERLANEINDTFEYNNENDIQADDKQPLLNNGAGVGLINGYGSVNNNNNNHAPINQRGTIQFPRQNQNAPVIRNQMQNPAANNRSWSPKGLAGGVFLIGSIITGIASAIAIIATHKNNSNNSSHPHPTPDDPITFLYNAPYAGGAELQIFNNGADDISIKSYSFTTNAVIVENTDGSYNMWGDLIPWDAKVTYTANPNAHTFTYTVTTSETNPIIIKANSPTPPSLQYSYQKTGGILNVGMNPTAVSVTLAGDSESQLLNPEGYCTDDECNDPTPDYTVSGYYNNMDEYAYLNQYNANQIPTNMADRIFYASIGVNSDGNIFLTDPNSDQVQLPAISQMRQQRPYLDAFLSFGSETYPGDFSVLAASPTAVNTFVTEAVAAMQETGFNGINMYWFPTNAQDGENYANLLTQLRVAINAASQQTGQKYYITIAASADITQINSITSDSWTQIKNAVDQLNVNTYNFYGPWNSISDHQSQMSVGPTDPNQNNVGVQATIDTYKELGFNSTQLVMGVPTFWRTEYVTSATNNGLYQPISGAVLGQFYDNTGKYNIDCLFNKNCYGGAQFPGHMQYFNDTNCEVPYGFSSDISAFGTGDNGESVTNKANYTVNNNLGGTFLSSFAGDIRDTSDPNCLLANTFNVYANANHTTTNTTQTAKTFTTRTVSSEQTTSGFTMVPALLAVGAALGMSAYAAYKKWQSGYYEGEEFTQKFETLTKKAQALFERIEKLTPSIERQNLYNEICGIRGVDLDVLGEAQHLSKHQCEQLNKQLDDLAVRLGIVEGKQLRTELNARDQQEEQSSFFAVPRYTRGG